MGDQVPPEDIKQRLKASYDAMAPVYNDWTQKHTPLRLEQLDELYAHMPDLLDKPVHVLELGCGAGVPTLETLLKRNPSLHAIANDLSNTQIALAKENLSPLQASSRVGFVSGDMTQLSVEDGSLAAVVAFYSIIHLPRTEQRGMVHRIAAWLQPGGCMLANFSAVDMPGAVMEKWLDDKGWMYWSGYAEDEMAKAIEGAGLKIERREVKGDGEESFLWVIARKPA
jgi:ubiquinone/menaquinone biosynthesis C-methylase UbiE